MGITIQIVPGLIPVDGEQAHCVVSRLKHRIYLSAETPPELASELLDEARRELSQIVFARIPFVGDVD